MLLCAHADAASALSHALDSLGAAVRVASSTSDGLAATSEPYEVVILDLALPGADAALPLLIDRAAAPLVVVSPAGESARGIAAVKLGAADFLRRPFEPDEVRYVIDRAIKTFDAESDEPPPSLPEPGSPIIGTSPVMRELDATLDRAARGVATVLVRGESGTGKELVARQLHARSPRRGGPFVKVHCGALPDNLLESELFGYEKGAFTGATTRKPGRVELAEGGTLFLDEIGDITPAIQVKLLRILQDKEYERLGGTQTLTANVRFVAATHRDLEAMVRAGTFREDLFYRLSVVAIVSPPLRERADDIPTLANHFAKTVAHANGRPEITFTPQALEVLKGQPWPGNVRQLSNFVERLVVMGDATVIDGNELRAELVRSRMPLTAAAVESLPIPKETSITELDEAVRRAEKRALEKALARANGNRDLAARILGVSRRKLYYKLQEHDVH